MGVLKPRGKLQLWIVSTQTLLTNKRAQDLLWQSPDLPIHSHCPWGFLSLSQLLTSPKKVISQFIEVEVDWTTFSVTPLLCRAVRLRRWVRTRNNLPAFFIYIKLRIWVTNYVYYLFFRSILWQLDSRYLNNNNNTFGTHAKQTNLTSQGAFSGSFEVAGGWKYDK